VLTPTSSKVLTFSTKDPLMNNENKNSFIPEQLTNDVLLIGQGKPSCKKLKPMTILRLVLLSFLLIGVGVVIGFVLGSNSMKDNVVTVFQWLGHLPIWASCFLVILMYCVALMFFFPGTPFNLAAGFLYGIWLGCGVALGGCLLGASIAFLCGRTIAREWVKSKMESTPKFRAVDWAIQKNGIYIVFLTRLSPLFPFPLLNYAFGITKVRTWQYLIGTVAGVLPATIAYTYLGTLMRNLTDIWSSMSVTNELNPNSEAFKTGNHANLVWLIFGAGITVASIIIISVITKRAISKATKEYALLTNDLEAAYEEIELHTIGLDSKI